MTNKQENKGCGKDTLKKIFEEMEYWRNRIIERDCQFNYSMETEALFGVTQKAKGYIQRTKEELDFLEDKIDSIEGLLRFVNDDNVKECGKELVKVFKKEVQNCKEIIKSGEENGIE